MTLKRVAVPSPNYSSRAGASVRLIVIHTAQGALTYQSLGNYFASSSSGVSSQVGIDDTVNTVGEYVRRDYKSWCAAEFNPLATQAELCGFAEWDTATWNTHPNMLANCAAWIAEEAAYFGIPIVALTPGEAQGSGRGVCQHADLGARGGGHWDCGPGFPMAAVLALAAGVTPSPPTPPTPEEPDVIILQSPAYGNYILPPAAKFTSATDLDNLRKAGVPWVSVSDATLKAIIDSYQTYRN